MKFTFFVKRDQPSRVAIEYYKYFNAGECTTITLWNPFSNRTPSVREQRYWFDDFIQHNPDTEYLLICDSNWYKAIHGSCKPNAMIGYISTYKDKFITYVPSLDQIFYNPEKTREQISIALKAVKTHADLGSYKEPGEDIINKAIYPETIEDIKYTLGELKKYPKLTCDIETYGLKHYDAGLASITFCIDEHNGVAFRIDDSPTTKNQGIRDILKEFFDSYTGTLIYHNISFDAYVLIYQLYMKDFLDMKGMFEGFNKLLSNFDDTMLIAYLATNNASGNQLSLKELAQSFAGNWAQSEISDVSKIDTKTLLKYNLTDGLSTWFVYNKYYPIMVRDNQLDIYKTIFKLAVTDIIQMQLSGLPIDMDMVQKVEKELIDDQNDALTRINNSSVVRKFVKYLNEKWVEWKNTTLKKKRVTIADAHEEFKPNSHAQLQQLFYEMLGFPIINKTIKGLPSTDADTLLALKNRTKRQEIIDLIDALVDYADVNKILTGFIPAFKKAYKAPDGWHYLCGNFRLGGTVSGRLSSNSP